MNSNMIIPYKCNNCGKIFTKKDIIYFLFDNPTCSNYCATNIMLEINRIDPELNNPEKWNMKPRSKSF